MPGRGIAAEERVLVAEAVVDLQVPLRPVHFPVLRVLEVLAERVLVGGRLVGCWVPRQHIARSRIEPLLRDDVVGVAVADQAPAVRVWTGGVRVEQGDDVTPCRAEVAEPAFEEVGNRHGADAGAAAPEAVLFPVEESKRAVLDNRPADRCAVLVVAQRQASSGKRVPCIHLVVAQEFVRRAMDVVRA